jgi:N-acyl-D-aspartate/D-glutamate deacylase
VTGELLIRGVAIVDATRPEPEGPTDVLARDGRIAAIGGSASASTIDGTGSTLRGLHPGVTKGGRVVKDADGRSRAAAIEA